MVVSFIGGGNREYLKKAIVLKQFTDNLDHKVILCTSGHEQDSNS
jgi:hypothetical protein